MWCDVLSFIHGGIRMGVHPPGQGPSRDFMADPQDPRVKKGPSSPTVFLPQGDQRLTLSGFGNRAFLKLVA